MSHWSLFLISVQGVVLGAAVILLYGQSLFCR